MQVDDQVPVHIEKFRQHPVSQLRSQDLQIGYRSQGIPHHKVLSILK